MKTHPGVREAEVKAQQGREVEPTKATCLNQSRAGQLVKTQMTRMAEKLGSKNIIPIFGFQLYAINCDSHGGPTHHIDMANSSVDELAPEARVHVTTALEALLKALKALAT